MDPPGQIGTPLRDGARIPRPHDYLPPERWGGTRTAPGLPDEWPTYGAWRAHVIALGLPDPGPHRSGNHLA